MAWNNEFPHFENNKQVLDWILKQYSTFNQRIQEIQDHFDEVAEGMSQEVAQLEQDFTQFQSDINGQLDRFEDDIQGQLTDGLNNIQSQINVISTNMATYINEHMEEWQAEASYNDHVMKFSNEASPSEDLTKSIYQMQLDGTLHRTQLKPPRFLNSAIISGLSNGQLQGVNDILLEGKGTYLVIMVAYIDWATSVSVLLSSLIAYTSASGKIPLHAGATSISDSMTANLTGVGVYVNDSDTNVSVSPRITWSDNSDQSTSTGAFWGMALRISDEWTPVIS